MQTRYYNPNWNRFINEDTIIGDNSILAHNLFSYCKNKPVVYCDPFGLGIDEFLERIREMLIGGGNCDKAYYFKADAAVRSSLINGGLLANGYEAGGRGPNPYGRLGSPAHRGTISTITDIANKCNISEDHYTAQTEYRVSTTGGFKDTRYADVAIIDEITQRGFLFQVGVSTKGGAPVSREVKAIVDLESAGYTVIFIAYK